MARDGTPGPETTAAPQRGGGSSEPATPTGSAAVSTGLSGGGSGGGGGVRLRRGPTQQGGTPGSNASLLSTTNLHTHTRSTSANNATNSGSSPAPSVATASAAAAATAALRRRRSSTFSDYSQDARDLLNPAAAAESLRHQQPTSRWDALPLAFALLPAVGGLLVPGGGAFVTDLMLLGLGAIFLHWSVTQPWAWYHSAQQIREEHEATTELAALHSELDAASEDEHDDEGNDDEGPATPSPLEDVKEENEDEEGGDVEKDATETPGTTSVFTRRPRTPTPDERVAAYDKKQRAGRQQERRRFQARQAAALRELFRHEVLSLVACFACPLLGAYLLHGLRAQLTRPSEGLISNYNLTIFLLGAEVRPLRHLLQLVQGRTLRLQRVVHANPFREEEEQYRARRAQEEREQNHTLTDLVQRLDQLEGDARGAAAAAVVAAAAATESTTDAAAPGRKTTYGDAGKRDRDQLLRDLRAQLQPELDSLARALRRTHKQQTLLEGQVAARFRATDQRLSSAVASLAKGKAGGVSAGGSSGGVDTTSLPLLLGAPVDAFWVAVLWTAETALAGAVYLARTSAALVAAVVAVPLWPVRMVQGLVWWPWGGGAAAVVAEGSDEDEQHETMIVSGHIVKGGRRREGREGRDMKSGKKRRQTSGGSGSGSGSGGGSREHDYFNYGSGLPASTASRNGHGHYEAE